MKKEYLDFLYAEKYDAEDRFSRIKPFDGSKDSCHGVERLEAERLLDTLDRLITNYIDVHNQQQNIHSGNKN